MMKQMFKMRWFNVKMLPLMTVVEFLTAYTYAASVTLAHVHNNQNCDNGQTDYRGSYGNTILRHSMSSVYSLSQSASVQAISLPSRGSSGSIFPLVEIVSQTVSRNCDSTLVGYQDVYRYSSPLDFVDPSRADPRASVSDWRLRVDATEQTKL